MSDQQPDTEQSRISNLEELLRDFQEALKSDDAFSYVRSCACCGTFLNNKFDNTRQELLERAEELLG
jgi:hypothetical protein